MTSDLDIYRTASVLIREHGEDADLEAAQRADAMLEKGAIDDSGCGSVRATDVIENTCRQICGQAPGTGPTLH
jgi:hypothetical protein